MRAESARDSPQELFESLRERSQSVLATRGTDSRRTDSRRDASDIELYVAQPQLTAGVNRRVDRDRLRLDGANGGQ